MSQNKKPVFCFNVDVLTRNAGQETAEALPGASDVARLIRKTGATSLVISDVSIPNTQAALRQIPFKTNNIYEGLGFSDKVELLKSHEAWAFVSNTMSDMRVARRAGALAIGVANGGYQTRQLRSAGADISMKDLLPLPGRMDFRLAKNEAMFNAGVARMLGLSAISGVVGEWIHDGNIATIQDAWGRTRCPRKLIDRILEFAGQQHPVRYHAKLCSLEWLAQSGTFQERRTAHAEIGRLREEGKLLTAAEVGDILGSKQDPFVGTSEVALALAKKHALPFITVRRTFLFPCRDVDRLNDTLGLLTTYEVAERLDLDESSVRRVIRAGKLAATMTVQGYRITPSEVESYITKKHEPSTLVWGEEARQILGAKSYGTLDNLVKAGKIELKEANGRLGCERAVLEALREERCRLNPGFVEWLDPAEALATYNAKQAARKLGMQVRRFMELTQAGFLPYTTARAVTATRKLPRDYPQSYIDALARYKPKLPLKDRAEEFAALCREARAIINPDDYLE